MSLPQAAMSILDGGVIASQAGGGGGGGGGGITPQGPTVPLPPGTPLLNYDAYNADGFLDTLRRDGVAFTPCVGLGSVAAADIAQANVSFRPVFRQVAQTGKINNMPAISSDGTQFLATTFTAIAQPLTYGIVFKVNDATATEYMFQGGALGQDGHGILHIGTDVWLNFGSFSGATGLHLQSGKWHMLTAEANGASSIVRLDGVQAGPFNCGSAPLGGAGLLGTGGGTFIMAGMVAQSLTYALGSQTAAGLEPFFKDKFGSSWPQ